MDKCPEKTALILVFAGLFFFASKFIIGRKGREDFSLPDIPITDCYCEITLNSHCRFIFSSHV
jgi:hypothetical protein